MTRVVVLFAAVLAAAAAVQGSQATFTASATNAGSFATASKFPPTVTLTTPANGSATTDTTPAFAGTADTATGDSTTVTIRVYSGTSTAGTLVQTKSGFRSGSSFNFSLTTALAQGTYTAVATQTDTSGNTGTSNAITFKVDTTAPTAVSVSADTLTYTYSEPIQPSSVWSGWNGSATTVHIRFTSSGNDTITVLTTANGTGINLGSIATNADYVSATATFNATMAMSADGTAVVLTLSTPTSVNASASPGRNMTWTVGAGIRDLAGNTIVTPATYNETSSDVDF
jgi:Bacterial Ig-like domain